MSDHGSSLPRAADPVTAPPLIRSSARAIWMTRSRARARSSAVNIPGESVRRQRASAPASGGRVQKDVRHQALRHPELPRDLIRLHAHRSVDDPTPLGGTTDFLLSWATRATRFVF